MKKILIIFTIFLSSASYAKNTEQCLRDLRNVLNDLKESLIVEDVEKMYEIANNNNEINNDSIEVLMLIYPTLASFSMGISNSISLKSYVRNNDISKDEKETINDMVMNHAESYVKFIKNSIKIYDNKINQIKNPQLNQIAKNMKFKLEQLLYKYRYCQ